MRHRLRGAKVINLLSAILNGPGKLALHVEKSRCRFAKETVRELAVLKGDWAGQK